jgi:ribosomal protein L29
MKHVRDSTPEEAAANLAELKRGSTPPPEPMPITDQPKMARDMSQQEREAFLREHKRRFG